jgi:hypothetical protein
MPILGTSASQLIARLAPVSRFIGWWSGASNGKQLTWSTNGTDWTSVDTGVISSSNASSSTSSIQKMSDGTYVFLAGNGSATTNTIIATTKNFTTFTGKTVNGSYGYLDRATTDGTTMVIAGGVGGYASAPAVKTSTDLTNWTDNASAVAALPSSGLTNIYGSGYGNGYGFIMNGDGRVIYSSNLTTWTLNPNAYSSVPNEMIYDTHFSKYYWVGNGGVIESQTTFNGAFTACTGQNSDQARGIATNNAGRIVVTQNNAQVANSTNGTTFSTTSTGSAEYYMLGIAYNNGVWVITGGNGITLSSTNGTTWTSRASGITGGYGYAAAYL